MAMCLLCNKEKQNPFWNFCLETANFASIIGYIFRSVVDKQKNLSLLSTPPHPTPRVVVGLKDMD